MKDPLARTLCGEPVCCTAKRTAQAAVFRKDVVVLEAQQKAIVARPDLRLVPLGIDAGGADARRPIDRAAAQP